MTSAPPIFSRETAGILVVDKPIGPSSMDVIRAVRRATGIKKVGHAGTLDPLASGVVLVCIGRATKLVERLMGQGKVYLAEVDLGAFTSTDDREGPREEVEVATPPTREVIASALEAFIGEIDQVPPAFSAIHVKGKRAYELARQGEAITMPPRRVRIDAITIEAYEWPTVRLRITSGKGVYIRSIARDLGTALGTGGHLASLRRESVGSFNVNQAVRMDAESWKFEPELVPTLLRELDEAS